MFFPHPLNLSWNRFQTEAFLAIILSYSSSFSTLTWKNG